jgi:hypothetical protein
MLIRRSPKLLIKSVDIDSCSVNSYISHIELEIIFKSSPRIFEDLAKVIIKLIELSDKFDDLYYSTNQRLLLRTCKKQLNDYLIKNN